MLYRVSDLRTSHRQALVAALVVAGLYVASPEYLGALLFWLLFAVVLIVLFLAVVRHVLGQSTQRSPVLNLVVSTLTIILAFEVASLIIGIVRRREEPLTMLRSAAALWGTNWLVFTIWYWRIDAGGPHARHERARHTDGDFLFPQMTLVSGGEGVGRDATWLPGFVDYLFLAFTTNTALSPTDAPALSRRAKLLMMLQALISLSVIVLIAARAVNLLPQAAPGQ
jgi:hypothetical protein